MVPKDGTPILGLIQDHVVSGVLMTLRGQFFTKEDFMHLVLSAFSQCTDYLAIPPPTIIKPKKLWSGKQVFNSGRFVCTFLFFFNLKWSFRHNGQRQFNLAFD